MLGRFPQFIDFKRYTDARKTLEGRLSFKFCHRLAAQTENPKGDINFELNFGIDEFSNRYVSGRLVTQLTLICQRCMETFEYPINIDLALAFVSSTYEEEKIQGLYESYFYEDSQIDLHALIEDEVILALPIIAKHEESDCSISYSYQAADTDSSAGESLKTDSGAKDEKENKIGKGKGSAADIDKETDKQAEGNNPFDILKQLKN